MARDRLAGIRQNQAPEADYYSPTQSTRNNPYAQQDDKSYEMDRFAQGGAMEGGEAGLDGFFAQISEITEAIRTIDDNITRVSDLHQKSLNQISGEDAQAQRVHSQIEALVEETSRLSKSVKNKITQLNTENNRLPAGSGEQNVRRTQVGSVKKRFQEALQRYQTVEQEYRKKYQQRLERQYRIVKPDATPQEIKAAIEDDSGGQIFSQALLNSNRYGEARAAYSEVQARHEDIKRIERTITELAQLFNDMATLVEEQDTAINTIHTTALKVEDDLHAGTAAQDKAISSARAARKKRWICFFIIILVLIIIGVALAIYFTQKK